jgi:pilus assembly protein CpaC
MFQPLAITRATARGICCLFLFSVCSLAALPATAQPPSPKFRVSASTERMELIVNTSRILEMDFKVPRMLVNNTDIVQATPLSPNEVQVSALKPGVTQLNVWDEQNRVHSIDILVIGDARELTALLESQFPEASLKVTPLTSSVVLSGYVPSLEMLSRVMQVAEEYYPTVINNMTVGGAQTVLLQVKVYEVSRTKLRKLGFDWASFNANDSLVQNAAGLVSTFSITPGSQATTSTGGPTFAFSIVNGAETFFGFLEALRQHDLVKVMAEPNLVTVSGRAARFSSGGEFPILIPQSLGTLSIEFREFGTRVDFVPIVLGNGYLRLDVRPEISEIDPARSVTIGNISVPGLRTRSVDTGVEMRAGQTLAIAGLIQTRIESQNRGLPWVSDLPWVGTAFRRVEETQNEIELLIMVTPEFVDAVDPHELPASYPGSFTTSPTDLELYAKGYLEVPRCYDVNADFRVEEVAPGQPQPQPGPAGPFDAEAQASGRRPATTGEPAAAVRPAASGAGTSSNKVVRRRAVVTDDEPALIGPIGYQPLK